MATIKLKYSYEVIDGAAKAPSTLALGEVAINNATNYESLFLKNSGNSIVKLPINFLKGISSDVQTQLNNKLSTSGKAADSDKLGGINAGNYYHAGNCNNANTDWTTKNLIVNNTIKIPYNKAIIDSTHNLDILKVTWEDGYGDVFELNTTGTGNICKLIGSSNGSLRWNNNTVYHSGNSNNISSNWTCNTLSTNYIAHKNLRVYGDTNVIELAPKFTGDSDYRWNDMITFKLDNKWRIGTNEIYHAGNLDITGFANKHGHIGYDFNVRELNVNGNGIHFLKYGNDAGGWDGADIYLDNEGNKDKSKLIFKVGDDVYDSFSFRIANVNPLNIVDTGININGDCSVSKNLNVTSWVFGKDALFSGGVQCEGGISSGADVRAGNMARFFTNSGVTGWLQLGDGGYKHACISAMYGNDIDDLEIKAINSHFNGTLHARKAIIDNLNVSGNLNVFSLTSNQTRVTNGDLWIQNSGKIVRVIGIDDNSFNILVEDNVLEFDDLCIIHSRHSVNEIVRVSFSVNGESPAINIDNQSYRVYNCTIISGSYLNIVSGDTVVRVGNKSNKSRQSSILHSASFGGNGAATIYYNNVSSLNINSFYPNTSYISSAIGDLKALGYGSASIMTNNGHFKGSIETTDMLVTERYRRKTQFIEVDRNVGGVVIDGVATEIRLGELQLPLNDTHIFMRRDAIGLISKIILVEPNDNEVDDVDGTYIKVTVENTTNQNFTPSIISRDKSGRTYTIQWLPTSVNIKGNRMITFEFKFIKQRHKAPLSYDSGWFVHNVYSNISLIQ